MDEVMISAVIEPGATIKVAGSSKVNVPPPMVCMACSLSVLECQTRLSEL